MNFEILKLGIVPTSVRPDELCVNGMSFSRRQSPFANSALVVGVTPEDLGFGVHTHDPLVGVAWQRDMERCAAVMGVLCFALFSACFDVIFHFPSLHMIRWWCLGRTSPAGH